MLTTGRKLNFEQVDLKWKGWKPLILTYIFDLELRSAARSFTGFLSPEEDADSAALAAAAASIDDADVRCEADMQLLCWTYEVSSKWQ